MKASDMDLHIQLKPKASPALLSCMTAANPRAFHDGDNRLSFLLKSLILNSQYKNNKKGKLLKNKTITNDIDIEAYSFKKTTA